MAYEWALRAGGPQAALANGLVLRAVRREFGLNRLRLAYVGGAPVVPSAREWTAALGIKIQRVDESALGSGKLDERYQALMQNAYA
jgi:long-subunit acyl-CoA synthetase (AMP-forming)